MSQPGAAAVAGNSNVPNVPGRILGIDAGGSGTRVVLLENGTVTVRPPGPPMNALLTDGFAGHLHRIIEAAEASRIALEAAGHLADLAESIRRRLGPLPVAGAWGVFRAPVIWDRFAELTGAVRPAATAAVGAALLAGQRESGQHQSSGRPDGRA